MRSAVNPQIHLPILEQVQRMGENRNWRLSQNFHTWLTWSLSEHVLVKLEEYYERDARLSPQQQRGNRGKLLRLRLSMGISGVTRICCEEGQRLKLCHGALTVDFRARCSSCSMTNSFDRKSCELLTSTPANLADYTILG